MMNIAALARAGNVVQIRAVEQQHEEAKDKLYLKNCVGHLYFDLITPKIAKMVESLEALRAERTRLAVAVAH